MDFKTQICTTKEQSERLLALGLERETADMTLILAYGHEILKMVGNNITLDNSTIRMNGVEIPSSETTYLPSWSLHRLIAMCPNCLDTTPCIHKTLTDESIHYCDMYHHEESEVYFSAHRNLYDNIIDCIGWLIKEGFFNEEFLHSQK